MQPTMDIQRICVGCDIAVAQPTIDARTRIDRLNIAIKTMRYVIENDLPFDPTQYSDEGDPRKRCGDLVSWITSHPNVGTSGLCMARTADGDLFPEYRLTDGTRYRRDDAFAAWMGLGMACAKWLLYPSFYAADGIPDPDNDMKLHMVKGRLEWLVDHPHAVNLGWDYFFDRLDVGVQSTHSIKL